MNWCWYLVSSIIHNLGTFVLWLFLDYYFQNPHWRWIGILIGLWIGCSCWRLCTAVRWLLGIESIIGVAHLLWVGSCRTNVRILESEAGVWAWVSAGLTKDGSWTRLTQLFHYYQILSHLTFIYYCKKIFIKGPFSKPWYKMACQYHWSFQNASQTIQQPCADERLFPETYSTIFLWICLRSN